MCSAHTLLFRRQVHVGVDAFQVVDSAGNRVRINRATSQAGAGNES